MLDMLGASSGVFSARAQAAEPQPAQEDGEDFPASGAPAEEEQDAQYTSAAKGRPELTLDESLYKCEPNPYSMTEEFPKANVFQAMTRIRGTINEYVEKMATDFYWHKNLNVPTLGALNRRFMKHEDQIMGTASLDIQIAYKQLQDRVQGMLTVHKVLVQWSHSDSDDKLIELVGSLASILHYLNEVDQELAPPLALIAIRTIFYNKFVESGSVANAIKSLNIEHLSNIVRKIADTSELRAAQGGGQLPKADGVAAEPAAPEEDETPTKGKTSSKKTPTKSVEDQIKLDISVADHVGLMVLRALNKLWMTFSTKKDLVASDYIKMIDETSSIHEAWAELFVGDHKTKNSDEVEKCLYNIMVVTLCMHAEENHRPTTALVRRARKFLVQGLKATSPAVQSLSKMMAATRASQVVLETSRKYASMGVEDDAATRMFGISCKKFEEKFAVAFSDIELFINETDDSTIMNFECLVERLKPLCDVLIVSAQSIPRCGDQQPVNTRTNKSLYKKHLRGTSQLNT